MLEINTLKNNNNLPTLISLSHAARLTGYHQDYLGQLCRAGKLPASKVGRNWFTSKEAVEKLTAPISGSMESEDFVDESLYADSLAESLNSESMEEEESVPSPTLVQSITISQVEGIPVAIRTVENASQNTNNLQSIITNMRVQSLQKEVLELREMLNRLLQEVTRQAKVLQEHNYESSQDSLRHSYIPNIDFGMATRPLNHEHQQFETVPQQIEQWDITVTQTPRYPIMTWAAATAAVAILAYIVVGIFAGSFLGNSQTEVSSIYYHSPIANSATPTVAGDSTEIFPQQSPMLPTATYGGN